jgi:ATP-binding cassette subfamily B protein
LGQSCERAVKRHASAVLWEAHSSATANALLLCLIALGGAFLLLTIGMSDVTVAGGALLGASLACACTPAWRLCGLLGELDAADKAAADIFAYLGNGPSVRQLEGARPMPRLSRAAEVENVTLANAAGRKLLDRVSLTIPAGARVAVVSADWQTHLALASLLGRYCDPASGRVLFDGRDIRSAALETVRTQIALAAADGMCFTGSVEENIRFGDWMATEQQVRDAAKRARADGLIESLPQGLATEIGPHGLALAPDAAFRIGMARALLRQPSLLVIQEPAAQIDQAAWAVIDKALEDAALGRTLVFAPTRLSTLRSVSRLYVFRQGRLVAQGSHAELLQGSEFYRHLNYVRFNNFRDVL